MGQRFDDMPPLVDSQGSAPMMMNNPNPWPSSFDSFGHMPGAAQPQSWSPGPAFMQPPQWPGWESQAQAGSTPMSWGTSMSSTPAILAAPMAVMPPTFGVGVHTDGWPRPLASREPETNSSPPWKNYDDSDQSLAPPRSRTPLSRSASLSSSPSSFSLGSGSLSRKTSIVRGRTAEALKHPPREWRTDFSLNGNIFSGLLGARNRSRSFGGGGNEHKVTLHPYIRYTGLAKPPMMLDLRESPNTIQFRALKDRQLTSWDMMRFVCEPPLQHMRFYHAHLPWYIDVESQNPAGVTLYDMFATIHMCMMTPIENADYYNVEMNSEARAQVADAWAARCRTEGERQQGIRRVDYLMGRCIMEGIQKGKDGMWEIRTRKPSPS
ncbi:hypothetical protein BD309DRAFT_959695 [Dichomitus squalens]|uniref:DUF6699 domain-containing protein n=1 Tax=Dichomitus squalens TaxID=114155 RepID=A0A4Q9NQR2_9APHY|nr:hypothetical protein BD309DRAFT_959695 [Dichomitus squalens]TBU56687.1 hypothetical protein BD310DRAFT_930864 [Dichomitus squalens]